MFKELMLLTGKKLGIYSILKLFITANDQEFGSWFHSLTAKTRIDTFINFFLSLFVLLFSG